LEPSLYL